MDPFPDTDDADDTVQRLLNDAKRAELEERYGAKFVRFADARVPPEIEGLILDHIEEFERQVRTAGMTPLRRFAGIGTTRPLADLPSDAVEDELEALLDRLAAHGVFVDFPDHVDAAAAYRFLVEELLDEEVPEIRIPELRLHFAYDGFRT